MNRRASTLLLAASALFLACQDATSPDVTGGPSLGKSKGQPGFLRARGATNHSGNFRAHFNARSGPNGEHARGKWFFRQGPKGQEIRQVADVVCLSITDNNTAQIGLKFTKRTTDTAHPAGSYALLVVQDNGKASHGTSPDQWGFAATPAGPVSCNQPNPTVTFASWPGNILVVSGAVGDDTDDGDLMVTPADATVNIGDHLPLSATFANADNDDDDNVTVTWTTSDATIATVASDGTVTAVATGTATITATSGNQSAAATITVVTPPPPPAAVAISVFESGGGPIANATVTITYASGPPASGATDVNGLITVTGQPVGVAATIAVVLNDGSGRTASQARAGGFVSGANTVSFLIPAVAKGSVSGVVTAAAGGATLGGVQVSVLDASNAVIFTTQTSGDGSYSLTGIAGGTYSMTFALSGYQTVTVTGVVVTGGANTAQNAALTASGPPAKATLNITVIQGDRSGPVSGAFVLVTFSDGSQVQGQTDTFGFISFTDQPAIGVTIQASDDLLTGNVGSVTTTLVAGINTITVPVFP